MITKIYVLTEPDGQIRYVGKTIQPLHKRLYKHLSEARNNGNTHRERWIRKLFRGGHLPSIQIIGEIDGDGCREEIAWIAYFKAEGVQLVNSTLGGDGTLGHKKTISEETRKKLSLALMGHHPSEETLKNQRAGIKKFWESRGGHLLEETKKKLSAALMGHKISKLTRIKISNTLKKNPVRYWLGKKRSKSTCAKMSLARHGCKASKETRKKMSFVQHKRRQSEKEFVA